MVSFIQTFLGRHDRVKLCCPEETCCFAFADCLTNLKGSFFKALKCFNVKQKHIHLLLLLLALPPLCMLSENGPFYVIMVTPTGLQVIDAGQMLIG